MTDTDPTTASEVTAPDAPRVRPSRRAFVGGSAATAAAGAGVLALSGSGAAAAAGLPGRPQEEWPDEVPPDQTDQVTSTFFATAYVEEAGTVAAAGSDGDLWPSCWADDGEVYTANGDGRGFSDEPFQDIVVSRLSGTPETGMTGEKLAEADEVGTIWADPEQYNRKPTGMVCVNGVLYLAVQDLKKNTNAFDDVPNASISKSTDHGRTWVKTKEPMFTDHRFTTIFFADFGKDSEHAVSALGPRDGRYVYAYGMDWNWRLSASGTVPDPTALFLARVLPRHLQDSSRWQFVTSIDDAGRPRWGRFEDKVPVLSDPLRRFTDTRPGKNGNLTTVSQGGVLYNAGLKRYLYTSWTDPSFEFYEAPNPWGPWKRFMYHNFGLVDWYQMSDKAHTPKNGGYGTTIPSKFVSRDGRSMWVQSNWWTAPYPKPEDNYNFNLRKFEVTPYRRQRPANRPDRGRNLARTGADVTAVQTCCHFGNRGYPNDGNRTLSEDSFDGTNKLADHWGYTFSKPYRMNRVKYTTGKRFDDGGWFDRFGGGLRVQVRRNFEWVDVDGLDISPRYPYGPGATPFKTYTLRFRTTWGDGVRIVGQPGGGAHFTSIAELEVYFD